MRHVGPGATGATRKPSPPSRLGRNLSNTEATSSLLHGRPEMSCHLLGASFPFVLESGARRGLLLQNPSPARPLPLSLLIRTPLAPSPQVPRDSSAQRLALRLAVLRALAQSWDQRIRQASTCELGEEEARRAPDVRACGARAVARGVWCLAAWPQASAVTPSWCTRVPGPVTGQGGHSGGGCKACDRRRQ